MRLVGSMGVLVDALRSDLSPARLALGLRVRHLRCDGDDVVLTLEDDRCHATTLRAEHVLLAVPPRLALTTMAFSPALPEPLERAWRNTATWMAPHAKYIALYDEPFWRAQGLSGEARSARGPLGEIHDASEPGGAAALFGFFGVPAHVRQSVPEAALRAHCRAQFARLFGERAATPKADFVKDWAADPWTATQADQEEPGHHGSAPPASVPAGPWQGRLTGIASEWSEPFPGYLAGAIDAAANDVRAACADAHNLPKRKTA
jgi:monoamine oxidase